MAPQDYKVVNTHAHEISGWTIISRLLYLHAPNIRGMNGDFQSDLATLTKNGEQLEDFHIIIIRLQKEIIFYGETVYHTRLLFEDTKEFSKSENSNHSLQPRLQI